MRKSGRQSGEQREVSQDPSSSQMNDSFFSGPLYAEMSQKEVSPDSVEIEG